MGKFSPQPIYSIGRVNFANVEEHNWKIASREPSKVSNCITLSLAAYKLIGFIVKPIGSSRKPHVYWSTTSSVLHNKLLRRRRAKFTEGFRFLLLLDEYRSFCFAYSTRCFFVRLLYWKADY